MIRIESSLFDFKTVANKYPEQSVERKVLIKMFESAERYTYKYEDELMFELQLRKEIVNAAIDLNNSKLSFAVFSKSKCNSVYWNRTYNGGFMLNPGANPSKAIKDIFINGRKYATECATAMMIVYYKALLSVFQDDIFNKLFSKIYLMDWNVQESLLKEVAIPKKVSDILLGDRGYFSNPDVDPTFSQWQGENVIVLPGSKYYGHGMGIITADKIIQKLNKKRKKGATKSAYFTDLIGRPNFKRLFDVYNSNTT